MNTQNWRGNLAQITRSFSSIALVALSLGCSDDASTDAGTGNSNDPYSADRIDCVHQINEYRATLDLPPLERWVAEESCADDEAASDAASGIAHGAFGQCGESAQNECPGWGSVESIATGCLEMMWAEGPGEPYSEHGHYINMSNPSYTRVACGYHVTEDGSVWALQNFQ